MSLRRGVPGNRPVSPSGFICSHDSQPHTQKRSSVSVKVINHSASVEKAAVALHAGQCELLGVARPVAIVLS